MKTMFLPLALLSLLVSCARDEGNDPAKANPPQARFIAPWLPGGGMGLYFQTDGEPKPIQEGIRNFVTIARGQYAEKGIPAEAIAAVGFLQAGDSRDDFQIAYAIKEGEKIEVYRGYIVPGFGGPSEWERVSFRREE